jgi:hypothetical protein
MRLFASGIPVTARCRITTTSRPVRWATSGTQRTTSLPCLPSEQAGLSTPKAGRRRDRQRHRPVFVMATTEERIRELEHRINQLTELAQLQAARLDKIEAQAKADADLAIKLAL